MTIKLLKEEYHYAKNISTLLNEVELIRLDASHHQNTSHQAKMGQYFTPASIAHIMASLLIMKDSTITILDAGAGIGSLYAACVGFYVNVKIRQKI